MPDLASLLPLVVLLLGIGAFAGVIGGMLGVGGGIVLVPAFFYTFEALGYGGAQLMQVCTATSLATIVVTSVRSVRAHDARGAVDRALLRVWGPFLVVGALLGVVVAASVASRTLLAAFAGLAGLAGLYMAFGRDSWRVGAAMPQQPLAGGLAGGVGFFSALIGIGGGTFGVPLMTLFSVPMHRAVGTASGFGLLIATPAVLGFLILPVQNAPPFSIGAVNLPAFLLVIGTTLITTPWGVRLTHRLNPVPLRRIFAVFLVAVAANMLRKALGW
jgi:uncharacterized membrane protein YfcA